MVSYPFSKQPLKGLYVTYEYISLVVRIPWWTLRNLLPAWRPCRTWTLSRCISVKFLLWAGWVHDTVAGKVLGGKSPDFTKIEEGKRFKGVWIDSKPEFMTGKVHEWAVKAAVGPARITGYWMWKEGEVMDEFRKPSAGEKVVYFLHGGGYVYLSGCPTETGAIPTSLLQACPSVKRTFSLEYRLASAEPNPVRNPFPAALIDATAGYNYLVNVVGYAPSQIIVAGDSAGGGLALALVRYLIDNPALQLPVPGALILSSPWADLDLRPPSVQSSLVKNATTDFLLVRTKGRDDYAARAYAGPLWATEECMVNDYISPASSYLTDVSFKGYPKTFIVVGGLEIFLDQDRLLHQRMREQLGAENVAYLEHPEAIHDYWAFDWHEPERSEATRAVANWVEAL